MMIEDIIKRGEGNAISTKDLTALTGLTERELRKRIETLRRQRVYIISSTKGYYMPANLAELDKYIQRESRRAKSTLFTLREFKKLRREIALRAEFESLCRLDE